MLSFYYLEVCLVLLEKKYYFYVNSNEIGEGNSPQQYCKVLNGV